MAIDAIELALNSPMDWSKVESVVYEVLVNDDLPSLRKVGGVADEGVDAVQESFYSDEKNVDVIVQVTSQKAQHTELGRQQ